MLRKLIISLFMLPVCCFSISQIKGDTMENYSKANDIIEDHYTFKMTVHVPRVYNNTKSLGYRKYQSQMITGDFIITWMKVDNKWTREFSLINCYNKTHKVNNKNVKYDVIMDNEGDVIYPRLCFIGNNKTKVFNTPTICFYFEAIPSYNIGDPDEPDNTLLVTCSGYGSSKLINDKKISARVRVINTMKGYVSGTLGCGCMAYGHVSPTRDAGPYGAVLESVKDVASVTGSWNMKFDKRVYK